MHRFLEFKTLGASPKCDLPVSDTQVHEVHARLALRSDGSIWLLAGDSGGVIQLDRGRGWAAATRLRLCRGDRIRLGATELALEQLCALLGTDPQESAEGVAVESGVPGIAGLAPLSAPRRVMERPRRNPGTGQVEQIRPDHH
jgi:hypothetical protein